MVPTVCSCVSRRWDGVFIGSVLCVSTSVDMIGRKERRCGAARLRNLAVSTGVDTMGQKNGVPGGFDPGPGLPRLRAGA